MDTVIILLVEDSPVDSLALEAILKPLCEELVRFTSGQDALRAVLDNDFALIVLAAETQDLSRQETTALIRQRERSALTPIIWLGSGEPSQEEMLRAYEAGASDYVAGPITAELLKAKVSVFLALARRAVQLEEQIGQNRQTGEAHNESATPLADESLIERGAWFQTTLMSIGDAVIATDMQGRVVFVNPVAELLTGWPLSEALGKDIQDVFQVVNEQTGEVVSNPALDAIAKGAVIALANHSVLVARDGTRRPIDDSGAPIRDSQGSLTGAVLTFRDITERRRAADRQRFMAEASSLLASSLDYETTLSSIARLAVPTIADWCAVHTVEPDGTVQQLAVTHVDPAKIAWVADLQKRYPPDPTANQGVYEVIRTGKSEYIAAITEEMIAALVTDPEQLAIVREFQFSSSMIVPLNARGHTLGAIQFVAAESHRHYGEADRAFAEELATRAAVAVDNARLYREARQARLASERSRERIERLQGITAKLSNILEPAAMAQAVVDLCIQALEGAARGLVALRSGDSQTLDILYESGYVPGRHSAYQHMPVDAHMPLPDAVRSRQPVLLQSHEEWRVRYPQFAPEVNSESLAVFPLIVEDRAIGALVISFSRPQSFSPDDLTLMLAMAQQCALALYRAQLYEEQRQANARAEIARQRWQVTLESIGDAVIATDRQGHVTFINPVAQALTGWPVEEAVGQQLEKVFRIVNATTRNTVESPVSKVLREGMVVGLANHTALLTRDGREIPIDDSGSPIRDEQGGLIGVILVFRDVTEQYRQQQVQAQLAAIVESSYDAIIGMDMDGIITAWNKGAERMYGYLAGEIIGHSVSILVPPNWPDDVPQILEHIRHGERLETYETRRKTKDGRVLDISLTVSPVKDATEAIVGASKIARDVTELKRQALELARLFQSEQQARREAEGARQQIEFLSQAGKLLSSSLDYDQTFQTLKDIILPDLADIYAIDLLEPDQSVRRIAMAALDPATEKVVHELQGRTDSQGILQNPSFRAGKALLFENLTPDFFEAQARDAEHLALIRQIDVTSEIMLPLKVRENIIGILTVVRRGARPSYTQADVPLMEELAYRIAQAVDNARLYAEARQAIILRDEFLSIAAHELKTPITSLRGFSQLLMRQFGRTERPDPPRVREELSRIDEQSVKLTQLVNQLLDISRLEAGRLTLEPAPVALRGYVQGIIERMQPTTQNHEIVLQVGEDVEATIDALRIEQVITNLITNAIKYSFTGTIRVEISHDSQTAQISVIDEGPGIPTEFRSQLFERFYQIRTDMAASSSGMGLGLYISRQIVELHGGTIRADFPPDGGTRFVITLPLRPAPGEKPS